MRKCNILGLESIDFQNGLFFKELTLCTQEMLELGKNSNFKDLLSEKATQLTKIIKSHTNLTIDVNCGEHGPCVNIPDLYKNHALRDAALREYMSGSVGINAINQNGGILKGKVSLKNSNVSGFFSEIKFDIYLPYMMYAPTAAIKLTAEEISACILHEVGHAFVFLEYLSRMVTTNVVMSCLNKEWVGNTPKEREIILVAARTALQLDVSELDTKELSTATDFSVVEAVTMTAVGRSIRSELNSGNYDNVSYEYLSDEFATRHGAGRHLVTGLDKMNRFVGDIANRTLVAYLRVEIAKFLWLLFPGFGWLAAATMISYDHDGATSVYDKPIDRFRRTRNQLVQRVKLKSISEHEKKQLLEDINVIDEVMEKMNDRRQVASLLLEKVFIWSESAKRRSQLELQRELEALAFNNLYVKSAQLDDL